MVDEESASIKFRVLKREVYRIPDAAIPREIRKFIKTFGKPPKELLVPYRQGRDTWKPYKRGGKTVIVLRVDGRKFRGESLCSMSDVFSDAGGRDRAMGRALRAARTKLMPLSSLEIRQEVLDCVAACPPDWIATRGICGAITGKINAALTVPGALVAQVNAWRRIVLAWLFKPEFTAISSAELTPCQWYALYRWIGFWKEEGDGWQYDPDFPTECGLVLKRALAEESAKTFKLNGGIE